MFVSRKGPNNSDSVLKGSTSGILKRTRQSCSWDFGKFAVADALIGPDAPGGKCTALPAFANPFELVTFSASFCTFRILPSTLFKPAGKNSFVTVLRPSFKLPANESNIPIWLYSYKYLVDFIKYIVYNKTLDLEK